jgi:hypothetical protein
MAKATAELFKNRIVGYDTKPADQFTANPLNYRKHPQRQRDAVNASLRELGWISTVVENVTTGNVIDGHERIWQALQRNEDVPYLKVELSEAEERLALAVFDPITNMAETDAAILDDLLREVNTGEAALQQVLRLPVYVDNDANAFALAEGRFGAASGASSYVGLTVGTGLGAGVVMADWLFTLPAGLAQPATGLWLAHLTGWSLTEPWLILTYALYLIALAARVVREVPFKVHSRKADGGYSTTPPHPI